MGAGSSSVRGERLGRSGVRVDETQVDGTLDRVAAVRDAELSIDRDRLRLDRVPGDVELLADLRERQVRGQERKQAELRRSQTYSSPPLGNRLDLLLEQLGLVDEDAQGWTLVQ